MKFKQITAVQTTNNDEIILYAINEEEHIYVFHGYANSPKVGKWNRVKVAEHEIK